MGVVAKRKTSWALDTIQKRQEENCFENTCYKT